MSEIRKFIPVPSEYKQAVAVETANFPDEEISIESWKWHDQHFDPNTIFSRWVGETDRTIISHGLFTQKTASQSSINNSFTLHIAVHPDHQQKGFGSELYQHLYRHLQQYMPCIIETVVREDKPQSVHFLEHRQFKAKAKKHVARLKIPANSAPLDTSAFTNHLASLGVRIDPLSTLIKEDDQWQQKLDGQYYNIITEMEDANPAKSSSLAMFHPSALMNSQSNPENIFIARYHNHWIGMAGILQSDKHRHTGMHTLTGVARPYRRNGIATTLMQHCINAAIQSGYQTIDSHIQQNNALFQIQKKLGYVSQPITIHYELNLS